MSKVQKNVVNIAARNLADRRYLPKKIPSKKVYDRKKLRID